MVGGDFIYNREKRECGFGKNGLILYSHITESKDSNGVATIVISPADVDYLFDASVDQSNETQLREMGANDFILKPFDIDDLNV